MTQCETEEIKLTIPASTADRLRAYTRATNGQPGNALSAAIDDGIDVAQILHPSLRERMGDDREIHRMSTAARVARGETAK